MYPCWRYKKSDIGIISKIIFSIEEETRLGGTWYDTPTELEAAQPIVENTPENTGLDTKNTDIVQPMVKKRVKNGNKSS